MKTPSDELFKLIRSLNTQEKVYFKKDIANKGGSKAYVKVFDVIDKMKIYDEVKLKNKLKSAVNCNNFKTLKSRTYESILFSLQQYHSDSSITTILSGKIQQSELLIQKKLYTAALRLINKSLETAIKYEQFLPALQLVRLKLETIKFTENIDDFNTYFKKWFPAEMEFINKYKNQVEYCQLLYKLYPIIKVNQEEGISFVKTGINKILRHRLMKSIMLASSHNSKKYFYQIKMVGSRAAGDWNNSYKERKNMVQLIETYNSNHPKKSHDYLPAIHNLLGSLHHVNKSDEYELYYNKAKIYYSSLSSKELSPGIYQYYLSIEISYLGQLLRTGNYNKATDVIIAIEKENNIKSLINVEHTIIFSCYAFEVYFMTGNYRLATKYLNQIRKFEYSRINLDVIYAFQLLYLIVYYETGNIDMWPSLARSVKRFLLKRGKLFEYEKLLINLFEKKLPKAKSKIETTELLKLSLEQLKKIFRNKTEVKALYYFDYISWLESKITNRSFEKILREKLTKKTED